MPSTEAKPPLEDYWRCFHCDFATRDVTEAKAHFGERDDAEEFKPICKWWASLDAGEKIGTLQTCLQDLNYERMENYKADQQLRAMDLVFIGTLRRELSMNYDCKWNGYVRDITAELEQDEQVSRRAVNERIYKDSAQLMTTLELVRNSAGFSSQYVDSLLAKGSPSEEGTGWISANHAYLEEKEEER